MRRLRVLLLGLFLVPALSWAQETGNGGDPVWEVVEKATRSGDMLARAGAMAALPLVKGHDVEPYLKEGLADPQWAVRKAAILARVAQGKPEGKALVTETLKDPNTLEDGSACDLIGAFVKEIDRMALIMGILTDPAVATRDIVMKGVLEAAPETIVKVFDQGLVKDPAFFAKKLANVKKCQRQAVFSSLLSSRSPDVVLAALKAIRDLDVQVDDVAVRRHLKSKSAETRLVCAEILVLRGDSASTKLLLPLLDQGEDGRDRFLTVAVKAPSPDVTDRVAEFLLPETPENVLIPVYQILAVAKDPAIHEKIEKDINSTIPAFRSAATRAIGRMNGTRALTTLHILLGDGSATIRRHAAIALGELRQAESVETLERAVRDVEKDVRTEVVRALSMIRDQSVIDVASFLIYDNDTEIKELAIEAVCNANHAKGLPILRISLEDRNPDMRAKVLTAFIRLDAQQALDRFDQTMSLLTNEQLVEMARTFGADFLPFLKILVVSPRSFARSAAVTGAAFLPDKGLTFLREQAATNQYGETRKAALMTIQGLSCDEAREVAAALVNDNEPEVRWTAIGTLIKCGSPQFAETMTRLLTDPETNVAVAAAKGLLSGPDKADKKNNPAPRCPKRR